MISLQVMYTNIFVAINQIQTHMLTKSPLKSSESLQVQR